MPRVDLHDNENAVAAIGAVEVSWPIAVTAIAYLLGQAAVYRAASLPE